MLKKVGIGIGIGAAVSAIIVAWILYSEELDRKYREAGVAFSNMDMGADFEDEYEENFVENSGPVEFTWKQ